METSLAEKSQYQRMASRGPLVFVGMLIVGFVIMNFFDLPLLSRMIVEPLGGVLLVGGTILLFFAERARAHKHREIVLGMNHALDNMTYGAYKFSRHPGYMALLLMFFGMAGIANSLVLFGLGIITCILFTWIIIPREEKIVTSLSGGLYSDYKSRVRMWF